MKKDFQLLGGTKEQLEKIDAVWNEVSKDYYKRVMVLKSLLISCATGGNADEEHLQVIRKDIFHILVKDICSDYDQKYNNLYGYWQFIKYHLPIQYLKTVNMYAYILTKFRFRVAGIFWRSP